MKRLLLVLLLCGSCWAANDFSTDPDMKAIWRFESATFLLDATINDNDLTNNNVNGSFNHIEGTYSADFDTNTDYFKIDDADLSAGFPLKSGDSGPAFTFFGWIKPDDLASGLAIVFKGLTSLNNCVFNVDISVDEKVSYFIGITNGTDREAATIASAACTANTWSWVSVSYDDAIKTGWMYIYNVDAAGWIVDQEYVFTNNINIEASELTLGNIVSGSTAAFRGYIDEWGFCDRVLTAEERDEIRSQTYDGPASTTAPLSHGFMF